MQKDLEHAFLLVLESGSSKEYLLSGVSHLSLSQLQKISKASRKKMPAFCILVKRSDWHTSGDLTGPLTSFDKVLGLTPQSHLSPMPEQNWF